MGRFNQFSKFCQYKIPRIMKNKTKDRSLPFNEVSFLFNIAEVTVLFDTLILPVGWNSVYEISLY